MKRLVLAAAITAASAATNAAVITNVFSGTDAEVLAYGATYESYFASGTKETFEGFAQVTTGGDIPFSGVQGDGAGTYNNGSSIDTSSVGTFTSVVPGAGTLGQFGQTVAVIDDSNSKFSGRKNTTAGGNNYFDSNDSTVVVWELTTNPLSSFSDLGFFLSDAGDVSAFLDIEFDDGSTSTIDLLGNAQNGELKYITAHFDPSVTYAKLTFKNLDQNGNWATSDGWGIDDIIVGKVPEPSSVALLGLGLLGAGMARRNKKA